MSITTMTQVAAAGDGSHIGLKARTVRWTGDAAYPDAGSAVETILRTTCQDASLTPVALVPGDCGVYRPILTETPAVIRSAAAAWPTADQVGNTIKYKLNGGAEQTVTLGGAHTSRAHLAASLDAEAGIHAYDDGAQVTVKTDRTGTGASFEITGGTANAVYLFSTTAVSGSAAKLVKVMTEANVDAGLNTASTNLSGTEFNATFLCE